MTIQEALRMKVVAVEGFIRDNSTKTWYGSNSPLISRSTLFKYEWTDEQIKEWLNDKVNSI